MALTYNISLCLIFSLCAVLEQSPADAGTTTAPATPSPDISATVAELRQMVHTLQQQVAAVHSTLLTQQTANIEQMCRMIASNLGTTPPPPPKDCKDVQDSGSTQSGVYTVQIPGEASGTEVYCDMTTDGGGWLVIQRRFDGSEDFYRTYAEYEDGFGNKTGEYYLGNRLINEITSSGKYELLVELEDFQKLEKSEHYEEFSVGDSSSNYQLHVSGPNGTAGDSLMFDHDGKPFSTHDADNDDAGNQNCAQVQHGGYWYSSCFKSNINGQWGVAGAKGIIWGSFKDWSMYVLKRTEMKIRPK